MLRQGSRSHLFHRLWKLGTQVLLQPVQHPSASVSWPERPSLRSSQRPCAGLTTLLPAALTQQQAQVGQELLPEYLLWTG